MFWLNASFPITSCYLFNWLHNIYKTVPFVNWQLLWLEPVIGFNQTVRFYIITNLLLLPVICLTGCIIWAKRFLLLTGNCCDWSQLLFAIKRCYSYVMPACYNRINQNTINKIKIKYKQNWKSLDHQLQLLSHKRWSDLDWARCTVYNKIVCG